MIIIIIQIENEREFFYGLCGPNRQLTLENDRLFVENIKFGFISRCKVLRKNNNNNNKEAVPYTPIRISFN